MLTGHKAPQSETTLPGVLCCVFVIEDLTVGYEMYGTAGFSLLPAGCNADLVVGSGSEQVRRASENTKISPRRAAWAPDDCRNSRLHTLTTRLLLDHSMEKNLRSYLNQRISGPLLPPFSQDSN